MLNITLQYRPFRLDVGFLRIKLEHVPITHWRVAFFVHVYSSMLALPAGFTQFSDRLLSRSKKLHRVLGYLYVATVLTLSGPSGIVLGIYANGGFSSKAGFVLLGIFWMYFTSVALIKARQGDFVSHKQFMMRSYALTLSAITLRAWKFLIMNFFDFPPMDVYRFVAWSGWLINLGVAELLITREKGKSNKKTRIVGHESGEGSKYTVTG